LIILLPACQMLFFSVFRGLPLGQGFDWRGCLALSYVAMGLSVYFSTESLSLFHAASGLGFSVFWLILSLVLLILLKSMDRSSQQTCLAFPQKGSFGWLLAGSIGVIVALVGLTAVIAPPNTWDSMTYHMSRVLHWAQNHGILPYATHILRQISYPPFAEQAIFHTIALSGSDRYANLVQLNSMIGCLIGVSVLSRRFGGNGLAQLLATLFVATLPIGILEGSSTQNDYVVALWLVLFVYFGLRLNSAFSWIDLCATAGCLGLALLTKATAYLYSLPFIIWIIVATVRRRRHQLPQMGIVFLLVVASINLPHFSRNIQTFSNPMGIGLQDGPDEVQATNAEMSIDILTSNAMRNLMMHFGTRLAWMNSGVEDLVAGLHNYLSVEVNDPRTTWRMTEFGVRAPVAHEDHAADPLHLLLAIALAMMLMFARQGNEVKVMRRYVISILLGFLVFCGVLRWQPWNFRLQLPLFVLVAPIVGVILAGMRTRVLPRAIAIILILSSIPYLVGNVSRPMAGEHNIFTEPRSTQYFANRSDLLHPYSEAAEVIRSQSCANIGVLIGPDDWEYPLWTLLSIGQDREYHLTHVFVDNSSSKYQEDSSSPCVIFSTLPAASTEELMQHRTFELIFSMDPVRLYSIE
jgi:4-amino-4-deoxy-L-arabinose transferase-like glycosyltransferase